ncbi:MAG: VTT domain-containing protein [Candidatus Norongarragalinales archaeon]
MPIDLFSIAASLMQNYGLGGLFLVLFFSASLLPFPSEPILVLALKLWSAEQIFFVTLAASTIAAFINYLVGLKGFHTFLAKRDPKGEKKAEKLFEKYGWPVLLASPWIPFIGDLMPVVAGTLNMDWRKFLAVIIVARAIKTIAVLWFGQALLGWAGF